MMQVQASEGGVSVKLGSRFGLAEAERLREALVAFAPVSEVVIDFGDVREFEDVAVVPLARMLSGLRHAKVKLRGLTLHQARMLRYFGVESASRGGVRGLAVGA